MPRCPCSLRTNELDISGSNPGKVYQLHTSSVCHVSIAV